MMNYLEKQQREAVVNEAMTWENTPYHHQGFVKGVGVDCAFILIKVYHACGLIPDIDPRPYHHDWHLHRNEERYLVWVKQYAVQVTNREPLPGDIILYKFGRTVSHSAIVIDWPIVIHADAYTRKVVLADALNEPRLKKRTSFIYSIWK